MELSMGMGVVGDRASGQNQVGCSNVMVLVHGDVPLLLVVNFGNHAVKNR